MMSLHEKIQSRHRTLFILKERENIDKIPKRKEDGLRNQIRVRESIMEGEGISIPHICYTQRESFWLFYARMGVLI